MLANPAPGRTNERLDLGLRCQPPTRKPDFLRVIRRIGLRVTGRRRLDMGLVESVPKLGHRVFPGRPGDQRVGQIDHALHRAPRVRQLQAHHVDAIKELPEKPGICRRERFVDRLVRVANANPVPLRSDELLENHLLEAAAVLSLILQDVRPAVAEPCQKGGIQPQCLQRKSDQIIEINRAAVGKSPLVVRIDSAAHLEERQPLGEFIQVIAQACWRDLQVLGLLDHCLCDANDEVGPLVRPDTSQRGLIKIRG